MIGAVLRLVRNHPDLMAFQHFYIDLELSRYVFAVCSDEISNYPVDCGPHKWGPTPTSSRLPAEKCTFVVGPFVFVASSVPGNEGVFVGMWDSEKDTSLHLGRYIPGKIAELSELFRTEADFLNRECALEFFVRLVALINEPRIVRRSNVGTRQQRRALKRGMGFAVDAWTRISWDLSKETVAKVSIDPTFHKQPLHYRRGHFRRACKGFHGAVQRPDALRPGDRELWWQWIEGYWAGHPAFGLKKSIHAPRMTTGELAKRSGGNAFLEKMEVA